MYVRVRFNANVGLYLRGLAYDVEDNDAIRKLVAGGLCDIIPYPPSDTLSADEGTEA